MKRFIYYTVILALFISGSGALAGQVTIPHTFSSGTKAVAAEVNANFTAVKNAVDDNANIIVTLQSTITTLQSQIATLQSQIAALQNNSVLALDGMLSLDTSSGYDTALFKGVNVQVVNGIGTTDTMNGHGNVIIGYNNPRTIVPLLVCSDGQYQDQATCETGGQVWAVSHKSGSHNLVVGERNSYSQYGGVVFGEENAVNRAYATVTAGWANIASGLHGSVSGGTENKASNTYSSVSGGLFNTASGVYASVSGGSGNTASGSQASVSGGNGNTASNTYASVSGGTRSTASGEYSSVSGGWQNTASNTSASVTGGRENVASGQYSSVHGGGYDFSLGTTGNTALHEYSSILGGSGQTSTTNHDTIPALP